MKLRSIELALPDPPAAARFMLDIWGMAPGEVRGQTHYLRGSGPYPYLVAFDRPTRNSSAHHVRLHRRGTGGHPCQGRPAWPLTDTVSADPGEGHGVIVELPEGELLRFLVDTTEVAPITGRDLPVKLTHIVFNSADAEASGHAVEDVLGFRVSDRTKGMVFVRCNDSHHSTAFARAGFSSLNHIAFEMEDLDAVMRGIGRMRDHGFAPAWGPGATVRAPMSMPITSRRSAR
jgi:catechol 2,3-dioxygenase-like lactoylglutathione lyase family enzyme